MKSNKWVKIEDEMPEIGEVVLVFFRRSGKTRVAEVQLSDYFSSCPGRWNVLAEVTHWQPIPKPPE